MVDIHKIFAVSDTHFSHANIIKYCDRPFTSVYEMDAALVQNWCRTVQPDDFVVHLGDFSIKRRPSQHSKHELAQLAMLPGRKVLIRGNHDKQGMVDWLKEQGWVVVDRLAVGDELLLTHNPYSTKHEGKLHSVPYLVHGHSHGKLGPNTKFRIDVGVDSLPGYMPHEFKEFLPEDLVKRLTNVLVETYTATQGCLGLVNNTFIMCGEAGNFCSTRCFNDAKDKQCH